MNGWHIVSLNANCSEISGGCSAGGPQEQWLSADLAQHAGMPTIAVWPLNKASSATEDQAAGITEIIVGTGGSSTYHACSPSEDTRVAKALDGDASLGALFFTMGSDGSCRWEFRLKSDGSVADSGAGRSHYWPARRDERELRPGVLTPAYSPMGASLSLGPPPSTVARGPQVPGVPFVRLRPEQTCPVTEQEPLPVPQQGCPSAPQVPHLSPPEARTHS
jgi:hypothetical protein